MGGQDMASISINTDDKKINKGQNRKETVMDSVEGKKALQELEDRKKQTVRELDETQRIANR